MKKLVFLLMAIFVASSAFALMDPDANSMGIYFDMNGDSNTAEMATFGPVTAYLIVGNATSSAISGFEAGLTLDGPATPPAVTFANDTALNVGTATNMIVGLGTPSPTSEITLLGTLDFYYTGAGEPLSIFLHGTEPSSANPLYPVIVMDGTIYEAGMSTLSGEANAGVNIQVVATEEMSFDNVKSLYR